MGLTIKASSPTIFHEIVFNNIQNLVKSLSIYQLVKHKRPNELARLFIQSYPSIVSDGKIKGPGLTTVPFYFAPDLELSGLTFLQSP